MANWGGTLWFLGGAEVNLNGTLWFLGGVEANLNGTLWFLGGAEVNLNGTLWAGFGIMAAGIPEDKIVLEYKSKRLGRDLGLAI